MGFLDTALTTARQALSDLRVLRQDVGVLQQRFETLTTKLGSPGTKFLVDLEYRLIYDAALVVPQGYANSGTFYLEPGIVASPIIETLPGALHAVYLLSAYCTSDATPVICDGASWSPQNDATGATAYDAIFVSLLRTPGNSPTRIDVTVRILNPLYYTARTIAVRVWRRLGMGS